METLCKEEAKEELFKEFLEKCRNDETLGENIKLLLHVIEQEDLKKDALLLAGSINCSDDYEQNKAELTNYVKSVSHKHQSKYNNKVVTSGLYNLVDGDCISLICAVNLYVYLSKTVEVQENAVQE